LPKQIINAIIITVSPNAAQLITREEVPDVLGMRISCYLRISNEQQMKKGDKYL
jgi:hypothetical protein